MNGSALMCWLWKPEITGQESISAQDAGLSYKSDGSVNQLVKEQQRFRWFLAFNQHQDYEIPSSIQYDDRRKKRQLPL